MYDNGGIAQLHASFARMAFRFFQNGVHDLYGSASGKIDRDLSFHTIRIRIAEFGIRTSRNLLTRINLSHMVNGHIWAMVTYGHIWSQWSYMVTYGQAYLVTTFCARPDSSGSLQLREVRPIL